MSTAHPNQTNLFLQGLWQQNPVFVQALGMCPTLAVTNTALNSLAMGLSSAFVLIMSALFVSTLRNLIPRQVRIACYILIIATFVTMVDYGLQVIDLKLHKALGAFVPLIVVNCLILGRAESFSSRNPLWPSLVDAAGMGLGFCLALLCLGGVRELLGSGALFGIPILPENFEPWVVMVLPSGGFLVLGFWVLIFDVLRSPRPLQHQHQHQHQHQQQEHDHHA
ncbi:MAG: electron transport complex subunit RsxE [Gammaproteobacteria bacterium]|nr:electron transport complex subunit RsxE [Gammaproteobacteria bacterium]MDH5802942.1 electron transport complex subunit RsxE [Gammaproteobacteria bacterium]